MRRYVHLKWLSNRAPPSQSHPPANLFNQNDSMKRSKELPRSVPTYFRQHVPKAVGRHWNGSVLRTLNCDREARSFRSISDLAKNLTPPGTFPGCTRRNPFFLSSLSEESEEHPKAKSIAKWPFRKLEVKRNWILMRVQGHNPVQECPLTLCFHVGSLAFRTDRVLEKHRIRRKGY